MKPLRVSWWLAVAGFAGVGTVWAFAVLSGEAVLDSGVGSFVTFVAVLLLIAGLMMSRRRQDSWSGPLLQFTSMLAFAGMARYGDGAASSVAATIWLAAILFPGTLALAEAGVSRRLVKEFVLGPVVLSALLGVAVVLAAHGRAGANSLWWQTGKQQAGYPVARALFAADTAVVVASLGIVFAALVSKLRRADNALRRVLRPVAVPGATWALVMVGSQLARLAGPAWALGKSASAFNTSGTLVLFVVPLLAMAVFFGGVVWVELIEPRLLRTSAGIALRAQTGSRDVRSYLAAALGDPSVKVLFRSAGADGWVGPDGRPTVLGEDDPERGATVVERSGIEFGAVEYDASLASEPDAIELALTAAGLAIDNERLSALSRSRAEEARTLTAALVSSSESVRDEVTARLEDGPLAVLADIGARLEFGSDLEGAAQELQQAASEVRRISHGVYPAELTEGGLAAALPRAAEVPRRRFARAVEVTAFLAADGDERARIEVRRESLRVALSEAPSNAALLARVAALGGSLEGSTVVLPLGD